MRARARHAVTLAPGCDVRVCVCGGMSDDESGCVEGVAAPAATRPPLSLLNLSLSGCGDEEVSASADAKQLCPRCNKRRHLYCPECFTITSSMHVPTVRLPLKVHILRGREEKASKSTSAHIMSLAPDDSSLYFLPEFPTYEDPSKVLLLFPSPTSVALTELPDLSRFTTLIAVDTTWQKGGMVLVTPQSAPFQHVHIANYHTLFWRYQALGPSCLSTVEAVYYACREYAVEMARRTALADLPPACEEAAARRAMLQSLHPCDPTNQVYDGSFDGLLTFFMYTYRRVQHNYTQGAAAAKGKKYTNRMRKDYIKYDGAAAACESGDGSSAAGAGADDAAPAPGGDACAAAGGEGAVRESVSRTQARQRRGPVNAPRSKRIRGGWSVRGDILAGESAEVIATNNLNYAQDHHLRADSGADMRLQASVFAERAKTLAREYGTRPEVVNALSMRVQQATAGVGSASTLGESCAPTSAVTPAATAGAGTGAGTSTGTGAGTGASEPSAATGVDVGGGEGAPAQSNNSGVPEEGVGEAASRGVTST